MRIPATILTLTMTLGCASLQAHYHHVIVEEVYPSPVVIAAPAPLIVANEPAPVVVNEAPPAPILEEIAPSPGPGYVCVGGNWEWKGRWVWKKHEWVVRPQAYTAWEPAHWRWSDHHRGYVWSAGHWR